MSNQVCVECGANDSIFWRNTDDEEMSNDCRPANPANKEIKYDSDDKEEDSEDNEINNENNEDESSIAKATEKGTRKRKRASRHEAKSPTPSTSKSLEPQGNGQENNEGEPPAKAPTVPSPVVISDFIFFKVNVT